MLALTQLQLAGGLALPVVWCLSWIFTDYARKRINRAKAQRRTL